MNMLRQVLTRSSRAVGSSIRISAQPLSRPSTTQTTITLFRIVSPRFTRCYSDETRSTSDTGKEQAESKSQTEGEEGKTEGETEAQVVESTLQRELEVKHNEVKEWKDKYLRSVAEFRNLQDRTQREIKQARDFAIQKFAKDLVDSVDNLDRALSMVPKEKLQAEEPIEHQKDLVNLYEGLKMSDSLMMQTLAKHGLERFDPAGEKFNPNEHEATFMTPMPDKEDGTVFHVQQKGFKLNGRIIRAAKVGVVKNK